MKEKDTLIRRYLSAGVCALALAGLLIIAVKGKATETIRYVDDSEKSCLSAEIVQDPVEAVYEKSMQIDYSVKEYAINTQKVDVITNEIYKDAYYKVLSGQNSARTRDGKEVYWKEYCSFQGELDVGMTDEVFLESLIKNTKFYYMDFDGDGLPELVMDIIGDGLHILKYLPDEKMVEIFFGYERMPYYHLLGSGQLYYRNPTYANKDIWDMVLWMRTVRSIR